MKHSQPIVVQIEHCENCHLHAWCSRHDENKYTQHTHKVKAYAHDIFSQLDFRVNQPESHFQNINQPTSKGQTKYFDHEEKKFVHFPRFGSFQIFVNGTLVFSKLQSNLWPKHDRIAMLFEKIRDQIQENNNVGKYSLEYRLKNDSDEFFRETYKKVIEKNQSQKPRLIRPLSQNHSQIITMNNRSPSNQIKPINTNFISRKLHNSLRKNPFSDLEDRHEFIKPYRAENKSASKGLKRPITNQQSRNKKLPTALEFNRNSEKYDFDRQEVRKNSQGNQLSLKGSPNPRRRLQVIRDGISKPDNTKNNINSPFNSSANSKDYFNIKQRLKNAANKNESETKKIGNIQKLSPKLHQSNIAQKSNNWMQPVNNVSPINSHKQPDKMFKRVSLKNQKKASQAHIMKEKSKEFELQQNAMEKSEERLIAKLEEDDSKELNGETIIVSKKIQEERAQIKRQEKLKSVPKAQSESDQLQIEEKDYIMDDEQESVEKKQEKMIKSNDEEKSGQDKKIQVKKLEDEQRKQYQNITDENNRNKANEEYEARKLNDKQQESTDKLLPKDNYSTAGRIEDKSQQIVQDQYEEQFNNNDTQQQLQTKDQIKSSNHQHQEGYGEEYQPQEMTMSEKHYLRQIQQQEERKKSTSIEHSLDTNMNHLTHDHVNETTHDYIESRESGLEREQAQSQINPWSKKENELSEEQGSSFKVKSSNVTDHVITNGEHKVSQKDKYEEEYDQQRPDQLIEQLKQNNSLVPQQLEQRYEEEVLQQQEPVNKSQPQKAHQQQTSSNKQKQEPSEQYLDQYLQQPLQRPQSRDSRSASQRSNKIKIHSQSNQNSNRPDQNLAGQQDNNNTKDFSKKDHKVDEPHLEHNQQYLPAQSHKISTKPHQVQEQQKYEQQLLEEQVQEHQPAQKQQQPDKFQQQELSQVQQSHHSIPIIVSKNDGTSKIINEEVQQELAELYFRQEQEKQQRQKILESMMKDQPIQQIPQSNQQSSLQAKKLSSSLHLTKGSKELNEQEKIARQQVKQQQALDQLYVKQQSQPLNSQLKPQTKDQQPKQTLQNHQPMQQKKFQQGFQTNQQKAEQTHHKTEQPQEQLIQELTVDKQNVHSYQEEDINKQSAIVQQHQNIVTSEEQKNQQTKKQDSAPQQIVQQDKTKLGPQNQQIPEKQEQNQQIPEKQEIAEGQVQPQTHQSIPQSTHQLPTQNSLQAVRQYIENLTSNLDHQQKYTQNLNNEETLEKQLQTKQRLEIVEQTQQLKHQQTHHQQETPINQVETPINQTSTNNNRTAQEEVKQQKQQQQLENKVEYQLAQNQNQEKHSSEQQDKPNQLTLIKQDQLNHKQQQTQQKPLESHQQPQYNQILQKQPLFQNQHSPNQSQVKVQQQVVNAKLEVQHQTQQAPKKEQEINDQQDKKQEDKAQPLKEPTNLSSEKQQNQLIKEQANQQQSQQQIRPELTEQIIRGEIEQINRKITNQIASIASKTQIQQVLLNQNKQQRQQQSNHQKQQLQINQKEEQSISQKQQPAHQNQQKPTQLKRQEPVEQQKNQQMVEQQNQQLKQLQNTIKQQESPLQEQQRQPSNDQKQVDHEKVSNIELKLKEVHQQPVQVEDNNEKEIRQDMKEVQQAPQLEIQQGQVSVAKSMGHEPNQQAHIEQMPQNKQNNNQQKLDIGKESFKQPEGLKPQIQQTEVQNHPNSEIQNNDQHKKVDTLKQPEQQHLTNQKPQKTQQVTNQINETQTVHFEQVQKTENKPQQQPQEHQVQPKQQVIEVQAPLQSKPNEQSTQKIINEEITKINDKVASQPEQAKLPTQNNPQHKDSKHQTVQAQPQSINPPAAQNQENRSSDQQSNVVKEPVEKPQQYVEIRPQANQQKKGQPSPQNTQKMIRDELNILNEDLINQIEQEKPVQQTFKVEE